MQAHHEILFAFDQGASRVDEINTALKEVWREILSQPATEQRVVDILGVSTAQLDREAVPLEFSTKTAGLTGGELGLIALGWLAKEVLLAAGKDVLKDAVKTRMRKLWNEVLGPALRKKLGARDAIGEPKDVDAEKSS